MNILPTPSPAESALLELQSLSEKIRSYIPIQVEALNRTTAILLGLANADLAEALNSIGPVKLETLLTAHKLLGEAVSYAQEQPGMVDTAPFTEKLAAQGRKMDFQNGVFSVTDLPQPEQPPAE